MKTSSRIGMIAVISAMGFSFFNSQAFAASSGSLDILRQGLLGAGTGALSAGASGGNAGKGALIGAGTNVIGGALLGFLTDSGSGPSQQVSYVQPYYQEPVVQPVVVQQSVYQPQPVYAQPAPVYSYNQPQMDSNKQLIKQGILGAGTGAIAASASGGNAGKGALIGAGTNIIGGALLDVLTGPSAQQSAPVYYGSQQTYGQPVYSPTTVNPTLQKHIIRKYDASGNIVSEEEVLQ